MRKPLVRDPQVSALLALGDLQYPAGAPAQDDRVELVLTGHDHQYERFAPQRDGTTPSPSAPREFVVGTGGVSLYSFAAPKPNSEARVAGVFGFLRLTLRTDGYDWQFVDERHVVHDSGSGTCVP